MTKQRVGLLFGGCSGEHEVSIRSAQAIAQALGISPNSEQYEVWPFYIQKDGCWQAGAIAQTVLQSGQPLYSEPTPLSDTPAPNRQQHWKFPAAAADVDVWFPVLHGPNGEDGTIQGLLQLMHVPFVGTGVLGSALGMDKLAMKTIFAQAGLPQVRYVAVNRAEVWSNPCIFPTLCDDIEAQLGYPCFVKPANLGSSVGISKVRSRQQLETALDHAASFDRRIIVEAGVINAREVECAVLGNDQPKASVVGEITYQSDFYDYETKYTTGQADLLIPAPLPEAIHTSIQEFAIQAFKAINGAGLGRVDCFYVESTGDIFINEINTLPGFTATSMYPRLWAASGLEFPQLAAKLIELAYERAGNLSPT